MPEKTITWKSSDGEMIFVFEDAPDTEPPCSVLVTISAAKRPQQSQQLILEGNGTHTTFKLNLTHNNVVSGTLYLRPLHGATMNRCVWASFYYDDDDHQDLRFEGCMLELYSCSVLPPYPTPEPILPPDPEYPEPSPTPVIADGTGVDDDLFPYVYLRHWPQLGSDTLALNFVQYLPTTASPPLDSFISQLENLRSIHAPDTRDNMEALAQSFLEGMTPFQGMYLDDISKLVTPINRFPAVLEWVQSERAITVAQLHEVIPSLLDIEWPALLNYLSSSEYQKSLQQVWASYFALVIILGYEHANLIKLTEVLRSAHLLHQYYGKNSDDPEALTSEQLQQLIDAPVLLYKKIFPLPPSGHNASPPPHLVEGWIEPYAIGDLQMLRQRFIRYQAGDIAHIENVMAGERRQVTYKKANHQMEVHQDSNNQNNEIETNSSEDEKKLQDELQHSLAEYTFTKDYKGLNTKYGPPTQATIDGTVTKSQKAGPKPGSQDRTLLARQVLDKSINRISRNMGTLRSNSTLDETEHARESVFDNSSNDQDYTGVYRWLNRIYQAYVINYGTRLMLEFMLPNPAARFLIQERTQLGLDLVKPLSLEQQGVEKYTDVDKDKSIHLAAYYGVEAITPPPPPSKVVSVTLRGGEKTSLAIPEGYRVISVKVKCTPDAQCSDTLFILVGGQKMAANSELQGNNDIFGEEKSLSIIAPELAANTSPPSANDYAISIRVSCTPSSTTYSTWQIKTYNALAEACQRRIERFYRQTGDRKGRQWHPPLINRTIERKNIKQDCITLLRLRHTELCGDAMTPLRHSVYQPSQFAVNEPRFLQFFDEVLEWEEMTYKFYAENADDKPVHSGMTGESSWDDPLFTDFLEADMARVLIPARPDRAMALIYYLSSGMIWFGNEHSVAVNHDDAALVYELKQAEETPLIQKQIVGQPWEVVVPTTMQVIDPCGADGLWQPVKNKDYE